MRKKRILALVGEGCQPPPSFEGLSEARLSEFEMEQDVIEALETLGHDVHCLEVSYDLARIREALETFKPQIVFNMLEDFHGRVLFDQNVVAYLELMRVPYTGCNPRGLVLSRDKALTKKICRYHRITAPEFRVFPRGRKASRRRPLAFPLIVKSLHEDASVGIAQASLVQNQAQLVERVGFMHEQIGDDAIAEEYIDGRELYLGVLGNVRLDTFPIWELHMDNLPERVPRIATSRLKWNIKFQEKYKIETAGALDLPEGIAQKMQRVARRLFRLLGLSGYARMDFRLREDGEVFLLEANANPDLSRGGDLALSADAAGVPYETLIGRILSLGLRYHARWD